jgi:hypothetical protein
MLFTLTKYLIKSIKVITVFIARFKQFPELILNFSATSLVTSLYINKSYLYIIIVRTSI